MAFDMSVNVDINGLKLCPDRVGRAAPTPALSTATVKGGYRRPIPPDYVRKVRIPWKARHSGRSAPPRSGQRRPDGDRHQCSSTLIERADSGL